jgi:hypothetical protein
MWLNLEGENFPENTICPICKHGVFNFEKIDRITILKKRLLTLSWFNIDY